MSAQSLIVAVDRQVEVREVAPQLKFRLPEEEAEIERVMHEEVCNRAEAIRDLRSGPLERSLRQCFMHRRTGEI